MPIRRLLPRDRTVVAVMLAFSLGISLGAGATLKEDCFGAHIDYWRSRLCYSDVQPLYFARGIDHHVFPYIHATLHYGEGAHGFNEYPVLTGVFMWLVGWVSWDSSSYLTATIILLALAAIAAAWLLWRMVGVHAIYWTASPVLALYAFHNWDLLAVAASVAGIYLWWSGRSPVAAFLFAVGGAFKLYPALFIIPLVCDQLVRGQRRKAVEVGAVGFGSLALINLPFVLINASGWWTTYRFHADRPPQINGTVWGLLDESFSTATENRLSLLALVGVIAIVTVALYLRRTAVGYPVVEWCAVATAAVIVLNKVNSPQYLLWLLPFLALLPRRSIWWALAAVAVVHYVALFGVDVFPLGLASADRLADATSLLQAGLVVAFALTVLIPWRPGSREPVAPRIAGPGTAPLPGPNT